MPFIGHFIGCEGILVGHMLRVTDVDWRGPFDSGTFNTSFTALKFTAWSFTLSFSGMGHQCEAWHRHPWSTHLTSYPSAGVRHFCCGQSGAFAPNAPNAWALLLEVHFSEGVSGDASEGVNVRSSVKKMSWALIWLIFAKNNCNSYC